MNEIRILLLLGVVGHLLCGVCDCLITYIPGGTKFDFTRMKDNAVMSETFEKMPLRNILLSMLLGCLALFLCGFGYYGIYLWMKGFSETISRIILIASFMFISFGIAHHIFCGSAEWFYVCMGRKEEALQAIIRYFKDTSLTMIICYIGWFIFAVSFLLAVLSGTTSLPKWAVVFNVLPLSLIMLPFRIGGFGNWAGAIMFIALLILI